VLYGKEINFATPQASSVSRLDKVGV
jgi:hypothetical protein